MLLPGARLSKPLGETSRGGPERRRDCTRCLDQAHPALTAATQPIWVGQSTSVEGATQWLRKLDPALQPGRFVFVSVPKVLEGIETVASIVESEGVTLVLRTDSAEAMGLSYEFVAAMITLRVHSALEDVGLTAVVSAALAQANIACNVFAGYHHDHLFVPYERAQEAVEILRRLAQTA